MFCCFWVLELSFLQSGNDNPEPIRIKIPVCPIHRHIVLFLNPTTTCNPNPFIVAVMCDRVGFIIFLHKSVVWCPGVPPDHNHKTKIGRHENKRSYLELHKSEAWNTNLNSNLKKFYILFAFLKKKLSFSFSVLQWDFCINIYCYVL